MAHDASLLLRLRPEARLLLLAAGPSSVDGEIVKLLEAEPINWETLVSLADRERATAIVWRRIRRLAPTAAPESIREGFERRTMVADFTSSYVEQRVAETVRQIGDVGIEVVLLKGAALACSVYGSFFERPMGDIDMLVDDQRAEEAWRISQRIGWVWDDAAYPLEQYVGHHHLPPLVDDRGANVKLEMHAALFVQGHPFQLSRADLLRDGRQVQVDGGSAWVPSREKMLLHACMHFAWSHMMIFGSWRAFRDVIALVEAGVDWDRFVALAESNKAASSCFWTLHLAERLVGAEIPVSVLSRLEAACNERWIGVIERHAVREIFPLDGVCPSQRVRRWMWETAIQPESAGHGSVRPWILDDTLLEPGSASMGGVLRLATRQLGQLGQWWRYGRAIFG
jgi:hypothetical protein